MYWLALAAQLVSPAMAGEVTLQHQMRLTDALGAPINGPVPVSVALEDASGAVVWRWDAGTQTAVNGYLSLVLDEDTQFGRGIDDLYDLGVAPTSIVVTVDGIPLQDQPLTDVPSAATARVASAMPVVNGASGASCTQLGALAYDPARNALLVCNGSAWDTVFERITGQTQSDPGTSCKDILQAFPDAQDGPYWLDPTSWSGAPFITWCDMTTDGGGWTLVGKVIGEDYDTDQGILDGADSARWISRSYLGDLSDLDIENALGPAYETVPFTDFLLQGLNDKGAKLAWRHNATFTSLYSVFSSSTRHDANSVLVGDFRNLDYREGCAVASGPNSTGPQWYGFNVPSDSGSNSGALVNGASGGWCRSLAGWGRNNQTTGYTGGGLGSMCQGRSHQFARHYWGWGDGCDAWDWSGSGDRSYNSFHGHAFFVR